MSMVIVLGRLCSRGQVQGTLADGPGHEGVVTESVPGRIVERGRAAVDLTTSERRIGRCRGGRIHSEGQNSFATFSASPSGETLGMPFLLRDATGDDLPRLREVFQRASLSNKGDRAALIKHPGALVFAITSQFGARVRVATVEPDLIVGFATTVPETGIPELVDLFTDPDWMRRGVATALIDDIAAFATAMNVGRLSVVGNPHALDFYHRAGFFTESRVATEFGKGYRMHLTIPK
jgi:GNAT superfamily N-acetyltransferase